MWVLIFLSCLGSQHWVELSRINRNNFSVHCLPHKTLTELALPGIFNFYGYHDMVICIMGLEIISPCYYTFPGIVFLVECHFSFFHTDFFFFFWLTTLRILKHLLFRREKWNVTQPDLCCFSSGINVSTKSYCAASHPTPPSRLPLCCWFF